MKLFKALACATAFAAVAFSSVAQAAGYPERSITMIVPFSAGGPTDTVARLVAESMSKDLGQQIIVDSERVTWTGSDFGVIECRWDEIVLAGRCRECGFWDITDLTGGGFVLRPSLWRGGDKLIAKLEAKVPTAVRYPIEHTPWH